MANTYAILALRRKSAHLIGEIEAAERQLARQLAFLANLEAARDSARADLPLTSLTKIAMVARSNRSGTL